MSVSAVFRAVIEPSIDRVPVIETRHTEVSGGREVVISHIVRRNVFTEFDQRLSRHLAATSGRGFPGVSVVTRWRPHGSTDPWTELEQTDERSVPHALAAIGRRALANRDSTVLRLHHQELALGERSVGGVRRTLCTDDLKSLERALEVADMLGELPFIEVSGDFDLVVVTPPDRDIPPVTIDLVTGRVGISGGSAQGQGLGASLYDIERLFGQEGEGRVYLASVRRALIAAKQDAVLDFRAAAERRILDFDGVLAGRKLAGHRLQAAASLVWRLKAGLGDSLSGLSEHAQLTAFDWQAEMQEGEASDSHDLRRRRPTDPVDTAEARAFA